MAGLIYTANFGSYDSPRAFESREKDVTYMLFSDGLHVDGWDNMHCSIMEAGPLVTARRQKVLTPDIFPEFDWYLWLDATMEITAPVMPLIEKLLASPHDFAAFKHNEWPCSYTEITECIKRKKDEPLPLLKARALLDKEKLPKNFGQAATGVLWRRNTETVKAHALAWWLDMQATTMRDQATFMLNLWNQKIYLEWMPGLHTRNKWFKYHRGHLK